MPTTRTVRAGAMCMACCAESISASWRQRRSMGHDAAPAPLRWTDFVASGGKADANGGALVLVMAFDPVHEIPVHRLIPAIWREIQVIVRIHELLIAATIR